MKYFHGLTSNNEDQAVQISIMQIHPHYSHVNLWKSLVNPHKLYMVGKKKT